MYYEHRTLHISLLEKSIELIRRKYHAKSKPLGRQRITEGRRRGKKTSSRTRESKETRN